MTKSTDYVIASTHSTFANSPVSFHEPCLPTGAPPGSSRQEFQKEKHSSRTEATAKTLVLKKTTGIQNTGPMELRKSPPRNRQQTPHQTTNYDKTNNWYNRTRSHRSTHQISAQQKVTTKAKQANFKTTTRTAQSEEVMRTTNEAGAGCTTWSVNVELFLLNHHLINTRHKHPLHSYSCTPIPRRRQTQLRAVPNKRSLPTAWK